MSYIKVLAKKIGIDKSIAFTSAARIIQAVGGLVSALFIVKYLTGVEQGFYYTFGSILAIQVFFELGMNGIITQYVAHEASHLTWKGLKLEGEEKYKSRLSSLLHFSIRWYSLFALGLFATLIIVGFMFFLKYDEVGGTVNWKIPWILLAVATSVNLVIAPLIAFLEGLGKVKDVAKYRFYQQIFGTLVVLSSFYLGAKLITLAINSITWILVATFVFSRSPFRKILSEVWNIKITEKVVYKKEIFPFQWKIALSWISGYFMFQLFNPVLFATGGAVVAGQMGMTLSVLNAIQSLSMSWTSTKVPIYSMLIGLEKYDELDSLFEKTVKQAAIINGTFLVFFYIVLYLIRFYHLTFAGLYIGDRFLDLFPLLMMMIPIFINQFVNAWATYLRCHKREPFLTNSIINGILCSISIVVFGKYFGVMGITVGYCLITFSMSFWGYRIYKTKKNEWHGNNLKLLFKNNE